MEKEVVRRGESCCRQRWGMYFQNLRKELFSIFVDNIPVGKDAGWLRDLFIKEGQSVDEFIPARGRRVSNSRFEFVRFKTLEEAKAAIRRWNGAFVGKELLMVKLADVGVKPRTVSQYVGRGFERGWRDLREEGAVPARSPKSTRVDQVFRRTKDVIEVSAGLNCKKRRVFLEAFEEQEEWLNLTIVAEMKTIKLGEDLEKELRAEGISLVKVVPLGGRKVLIQFACVDDLERCLTEDFSSVLRNFSMLQRWSEKELPTTRSVWISVLGLPFKAWTESNCERLSAPYGVFLKMDDRDVRFVGVGRARMMIETCLVGRFCEILEADISGRVYEIRLCEDCCLGGCGIDSPESLVEGGNSEANIGVRGWEVGCGESDRVVNRWESVAVKSANPGLEAQGSLVSNHFVPDPPGKEVVCDSSPARSAGNEDAVGKTSPVRDMPVSSWNATLGSFMQQKGKRSAGKGFREQVRPGGRLSSPGTVGKALEHGLVECVDSVLLNQAETVVDSPFASDALPVGRRVGRVCGALDKEEDELSLDDDFSQEEVFSSRVASLEGASKRVLRQSSSLAQKTFKVVKRRETKEKGAYKLLRRKKRAELEGLKKSYLEELGKSFESNHYAVVLKNSNKATQLSEADSPLEVDRGGVDGDSRQLCQMTEVEELGKFAKTVQMREDGSVPAQKLCEKIVDTEELERRVIQRKEAEKMFHFNWKVGIRGSLSEEGMIQLFDNMLEEKYVEQMKGK
ncbi:unnamed protein product [Rhodiola kirilowii]